MDSILAKLENILELTFSYFTSSTTTINHQIEGVFLMHISSGILNTIINCSMDTFQAAFRTPLFTSGLTVQISIIPLQGIEAVRAPSHGLIYIIPCKKQINQPEENFHEKYLLLLSYFLVNILAHQHKFYLTFISL